MVAMEKGNFLKMLNDAIFATLRDSLVGRATILSFYHSLVSSLLFLPYPLWVRELDATLQSP